MFIDFEGIDGSGKTTLSNLLAARLRRLGYRVMHAREGGELESPLARCIRELTRDSRYLEMSAYAEFFLNLARDTQQLEEVITPAIARGEVCISDRYLYSQLALSGGGRGLPTVALEAACQLAGQGLWPDLVILVDVDPELARLRKRLGKLNDNRSRDSRKGLVGEGLTHRVRDALLELARKDPARWPVIENNDQPLWAVEQRIVELVVSRLEGRELAVPHMTPPAPVALNAGPVSLEEVEERFFRALDALESREPALATWMLRGLPGSLAHQRRLSSAERLPGLVARTLSDLTDEAAWTLRELLAATVPVDVAMSLCADASPRAMALREKLYERAPSEVLLDLQRNGSADAWCLRDKGLAEGRLRDVLGGLAGVDDAAAWSLRDKGLRARLHAETARSLKDLGTPRADAMREALVGFDRLAVLRSVHGLDTPFAWALREALFDKATKLVLRSLFGLTTHEAFRLRERGVTLTKEALDSVDGLDHPRAWELREAHALRWPSTALSSLRRLPLTTRAEALILRVLKAYPRRLGVLRNAYAVLAFAQADVIRERTSRLAPRGVSAQLGVQTEASS